MMTVPLEVFEVIQTLQKVGYKAYVVGGCVRDSLLGRAAKDYDVTTSATPEQVKMLFSKVIPTGIDHGTVTVLTRGEPVEVTTFRTEGKYTDGRRPDSVAFETDVEADLGRRDFTINAMAYDPVAEVLVDPYGGQEDLKARRVRAVGSPQDRFAEDGLRAIRAVRFATVLSFDLDEATFDAIKPALETFKKVAIERVQVEFVKILMSPRPSRGMQLLGLSGLLGAFLPEANPFTPQGGTPVDLHVRLAVLMFNVKDVVATMERLKFPTADINKVAHLCSTRELPPTFASDAELRRWLAKVGPDAMDSQFYVLTALGKMNAEVATRLLAIHHSRPPLYAKDLALNGKDVQRILNTGPGPAVGRAIRKLTECVLEDPGVNTVEGLTAILRTN